MSSEIQLGRLDLNIWKAVVDELIVSGDMDSEPMPEDKFVKELSLSLYTFSDSIEIANLDPKSIAIMFGSLLITGWQLGSRSQVVTESNPNA